MVMFDHDYSESVLAWMIAIPAAFLVMVLVAAMLVFCGLLVVGAIALAMLLAILAIGLALLPLGLFLAIPALVIYGIFKLIQRDRMVASVPA